MYLVAKPLIWSEAEGDLVMIETCSPRLRETFQLFNPSVLLSCNVSLQYQAELSIKAMRIRGMTAKILVVSTVGNV